MESTVLYYTSVVCLYQVSHVGCYALKRAGNTRTCTVVRCAKDTYTEDAELDIFSYDNYCNEFSFLASRECDR